MNATRIHLAAIGMVAALCGALSPALAQEPAAAPKEAATERALAITQNDPKLQWGACPPIFPAGCEIIPNPFNRIPGFMIREHLFVPGFPQMAWPMIEWVLDSRYRHLFDSERWAEASIIVYEAGESMLIPAMETVE